VPPFFLADGTIKVRLTDSKGVVQGEWDNLLVIGPSSGSGGGGSTVDSTTIFQTGDPIFLEIQGTRNGFTRDNGRTIGNALSGATERANADCASLFAWYWTNFSDSVCPVSGGRGASAAADFAANKTITVLDKRGVGAIGLDDMGNAAAGRFTNVPFTSGNATTAGSICGENAHTNTIAEMAAHDHGGATSNDSVILHATTQSSAVNDGGRCHGFLDNILFGAGEGPNIGTTDPHTHTITSQGSSTPHNTVQRSITGTWFRKL